ncbi:MFS transporter [uncultured Aliiroseovarius sp.]|uniref:MFS transporter n=1 Tax=uncultured Aliiroseovarius sp. TaxID=1658783 RepID=UPI002592A7CA|nr:MFS transporter [uncultured Aliiroseovarius sp.]
MLTDVYRKISGGPAKAGGHQPAIKRRDAINGLIHVVSLSATKTADALIDPKLVLSWVMHAIGAPTYLIGALVPVREAGALLPQLFIARQVQSRPTRRKAWSLGAAVQGVMAIVIAATAFTLGGASAGWLIVAALGVLAISRAVASTTYKDALARSVPQGRRGAITGAAASIAAAFGLAYGAAMALGVFGGVSVAVVAGFISLAGLLFLAASLLFLNLQEEVETPEAQDKQSWADFFAPLWSDRQLQLFILSRGFLTATALAPPFIVMITVAASENSLTQLGPLVVASSLAAVLSAFVWGRVSDRSSRLSLILSGFAGAVVYALVAMLALATSGPLNTWLAAILMFAAQVAYQGVRSGRSIYLTDMTHDDTRLGYTALSNTIIGLILLAGLGLGGVAHFVGPEVTLVVCAAMSAIGALIAMRLAKT